MRAAEIRRLSAEELVQKIDDSRDDLFRLRFQLISGQLQNYETINQTKKEIARIKTIIRERELQINQTQTAEESAPVEE